MKTNVSDKLLRLRNELHLKVVEKMKELNFCASDQIVESFKRWYLWDYHNVETSRSLSEEQLHNAIKSLQTISKTNAISAIVNRYTAYESERDLLNCSDGQIRNITAIAKYKLKLSKDETKKYLEKTIHRKMFFWKLTIEEAHQCIKRLEEWEKKVDGSAK